MHAEGNDLGKEKERAVKGGMVNWGIYTEEKGSIQALLQNG